MWGDKKKLNFNLKGVLLINLGNQGAGRSILLNLNLIVSR